MADQIVSWRERVNSAKIETQVHVSMQDVDISRIHFVSVFSYFDRNETQLFTMMGIPISVMVANGFAMPVVSTGCDYKKPFGLDDRVTVVSAVDHIGSRSLKIRHTIFGQAGEVLADAFTIHVAVEEAKNAAITVDELFIGMGL